MNYQQSVEWMTGLRRYGIKLGLGRFEEVLRRAGSPHIGLRCIHVAGTNGKGSTATMAAGALEAAGYRVGLYLSPYVFDLRERIQVNGKMISRQDFSRLATTARSIVEEVERTEWGQATEFEAKTLIGFLHFAEQNVDYGSIEVGIGGRLDSTNVITPLVSVITNVHFDHMDILGPGLEEIASEKAGIIKPGIPVVSGALLPEARAVIEKSAAERGAPLTSVRPFDADSPANTGDLLWRLHPGDESFDLVREEWKLENVRPALQGDFQAANAGCAAGGLLALREHGASLQDEHIRAGIERAWLPGRLQVLSREPLVIADGAHNPAAAGEVARFLRQRAGDRPLVLVIGMMKTHEPEEVLGHLAPLAQHVVATVTGEQGSRSAEEIRAEAEKHGVQASTAPEVNAGIARAMEVAGPEGIVMATGSFYLVGRIQYPLLQSPATPAE